MFNFGNVPFEELPPELQQMIKQLAQEQQHSHDMHNMHAEASRHRMRDFIESLNEEQLLCMRGMITMMIADSDNETAGYYLGLTASQMSHKFGYCLFCNVKHESPEEHFSIKDSGHIADRIRDLSEDDVLNMHEYNIELAPGGGYRCANCKVSIASISDRMLRPPGKEGCNGCIQKEKWG